jgi:hypothetical protein
MAQNKYFINEWENLVGIVGIPGLNLLTVPGGMEAGLVCKQVFKPLLS